MITLRIGEAMIFAPAALVRRQAPRNEEASPEAAHVEVVEPLGHGYLTVRSRERITVDGGYSVLAVDSSSQARSVSASDKNSISPTPIAKTMQAQTRRPQSLHAVDDERSDKVEGFGLISSTSSLEVDGLRSSSSSNVQGFGRNLTPAANTTVSMPPSHDVKVETPQPSIDWSSKSEAAPTAGGRTASTPVHSTKPEARFQRLIEILQKKTREGQSRVVYSELGAELRKLSLYKRLGEFLREAEQANLVELGRTGDVQWVKLSNKGDQPCPREYAPLVDVMQALLAGGERQPRRSKVATKIYKMDPNAVSGTFKTYISGAVAAGVVVLQTNDRLQLCRI